MQALEQKTPVDMLVHWAHTRPNDIYLHQPVRREWRSWSWAQTLDEVSRMATALKARGYAPGSRIAILSKNCAHWFMADFAIMLAGYVSVPLFQNQSPEGIRYVLEHSDAKLVFVGKLDEPDKVDAALPATLARIAFPYPGKLHGDDWDELLARHPPAALETAPVLDDVATFIYTSGTTGHPKGAVHRYRQIAAATAAGRRAFGLNPQDSFFSYLPLSHAAERFMVEMISVYGGVPVYFAESLETFAADLQHVQPTLFFAVPRLWTKFQQGILAKLPQRKLDLLLRLPIVSGLIRRKIRHGLGLSRARLIISGAAAISPALQQWYQRLGVNIQEGYAMTELFCYGVITPPDGIRIGYVGKPLPGLEVKTAANGELLLRCPAVMDGYYRDPEKTAEVLTPDGFYRTGDLGEIDREGYVRITGRAREQFKTAKGKFVSPTHIEGKLLENQAIEQICLMGSDLPHTIAVAVLSEQARQSARDALQASLAATVDRVNRVLEKHEQVGKLVVVSEPWTIDNGLLTPTLKLKRHVVEQRYLSLVEKLIEHPDVVMWE